MKDFFKGFWYEEEGMEIIQVIMIIAIVIALALLFKDGIMDYAQKLMTKFFDTDNVNRLEETAAYQPPN